MTDILSAALEHAGRGWHVHPVDHPDLPACAGVRTHDHDPATCTQRGKHPCTKWSSWATTDKSAIVSEWAGALRNVAVATGPSNLLVVDEDQPGGLGMYADTIGVTVPHTYTVRTGREGGGRHYYFQMPVDRHGDSNGALKPFGCDVRGDGGYVVAAGSKHQSGHLYTVEVDSHPAPCPDWLHTAIKSTARSSPFTDPGAPFTLPEVITAGNLDGTDGRDETLFRFACSLRGKGTRVTEAVDAMRTRGAAASNPQATRTT